MTGNRPGFRAEPVFVVAPANAGKAWRLVEAAERRGMRLGAPRVPGPKYYWGGPLFADRYLTGVGLLEPADSWLAELPREYTGREIRLTTAADACLDGPMFVKPPSSKEFPAAVYETLPPDLAPGTPVLVSEVVAFAAEFRLFTLDGTVHTGSRSATWGQLDPGPLDEPRVVEFADTLLAKVGDSLPSAVVLDVGVTGPPDDPRREVAVVEANMAWFAQPYQADADRALDVVLRAAGPLEDVSESDRRFLR
jgi:hypothetical protein